MLPLLKFLGTKMMSRCVHHEHSKETDAKIVGSAEGSQSDGNTAVLKFLSREHQC